MGPHTLVVGDGMSLWATCTRFFQSLALFNWSDTPQRLTEVRILANEGQR